jgi:hypothetical protein
VLVIGRRDIAASPIVADSIALVRNGPLPVVPAVVERDFLVNGTVTAVAADTWTVGGASFTVNNAETPAVIGARLGVGSDVTVEFMASTPPAPEATLWAPLGLPFAFNSPSVTVSATLAPPAVTVARNGFIFLRATDGVQRASTIALPATLGAVAAPPPPAGGGGGGGGGGGFIGGGGAPPATVTLTGLTGTLTLNSSGAVQSAVALTNGAGTVTLNIPAGSVLKTSSGSNLGTMTVSAPDTIPAAPDGKAIVMAQNFGPDGATFSPPIKLTLSYGSAAALPAGVTERSLVVVVWDGTRWLIQESEVDVNANTVSASVAHFTIYGIMGDRAAPTTPPTTPAPTSPTTTVPPTTAAPTTPPTTRPPTTAAPTVTTQPPQTTPPAPVSGGTNWGVIIGIIAAVLVIIAIAVFLLRRKPGTAA